jgi:hypothetical protein
LDTWDIAVALDPTATVPADAAGLIVDTLDGLVPRVSKPVGEALRGDVTTHDPDRRFLLEFSGDGARPWTRRRSNSRRSSRSSQGTTTTGTSAPPHAPVPIEPGSERLSATA